MVRPRCRTILPPSAMEELAEGISESCAPADRPCLASTSPTVPEYVCTVISWPSTSTVTALSMASAVAPPPARLTRVAMTAALMNRRFHGDLASRSVLTTDFRWGSGTRLASWRPSSSSSQHWPRPSVSGPASSRMIGKTVVLAFISSSSWSSSMLTELRMSWASGPRTSITSWVETYAPPGTNWRVDSSSASQSQSQSRSGRTAVQLEDWRSATATPVWGAQKL